MLVNSHQRSNRGALAKWKKWYWKRWVNSRVMSCPGSLSLSLSLPPRFCLALFTCPLSVSFHPRAERRGARLCSREYAPASRSSAGTSCSHGRGPGRSSFEFEKHGNQCNCFCRSAMRTYICISACIPCQEHCAVVRFLSFKATAMSSAMLSGFYPEVPPLIARIEPRSPLGP